MGYPNIDGLLAGIVYNKLATLHELKTVYSLEDAKWLEECYAIPRINEQRWYERQRRNAEARNRIR